MSDRPRGFYLDELQFGTLNNFRDAQENMGASRRRDSSRTLLDLSLSRAYGKDALKTVERFTGVVVGKRQVSRATFQKKGSIIMAFSGQTDSATGAPVSVASPYFIYKVYIPELDPRPYPLSANDPVIHTYPDVHANTDVDMQYAELPLGGLVALQYGDADNLTDPVIVEYMGASPLTWEGMDGNLNELAFKGGSILRTGGTRSTVGGNRGPAAPEPSGVGPRRMNKGPKYTYAQLKPIYTLFRPLLDAIAKPESGTRGYDAGNQPGTYRAFNMSEELFGGSAPADVKLSVVQSKMTNNQLFASGRYQITPKTLGEALSVAAISAASFNYDNITQDILGIELLLYRRGRTGLYLTGQSDDIVGAAQSLAMEWAGVPVQFDQVGGDGSRMVYRGESFYKYVGKNAAHEQPEVYISALRRTRQNLEGNSEAQALFGGTP